MTGKILAFSLSDPSYLKQEGYYGENGELRTDENVQADAICYVSVKHEKGTIEIGQYLWAVMHESAGQGS